MRKIFKIFYAEIKELKFYILIGILILAISYALPVITNGKSNLEDNLIEYLTALGLLSISILFLILYFRTRHFLNLLFCLVFFFGFGEEISWGQRILEFQTPDLVEKGNAQDEFTIHNLRIFNALDENGNPTKGLNINMLFALFCLGYGVLLPVLSIIFKNIERITNFIGLDIPPVSLGLLFIVKSMVSTIIFSNFSYKDLRIGESSEFISVFILFLISLSFLRSTNPKKILEAEM